MTGKASAAWVHAAVALAVTLAVVAPLTHSWATVMPPPTVGPPRTPQGLRQCTEPLTPERTPTPFPGEIIEYDVEVLGMDIGTVEIAATRRGQLRGQAVTELRGDVKLDGLLGKLVPLEGAAAAMLAEQSLLPLQASSRYRWATWRHAEFQSYSPDGREVHLKRNDGEDDVEQRRSFHAPVQDMLSAIYLLRRLPKETSGCSLIYANAKAYTIWLDMQGHETVEVGAKKRSATRYDVKYASDEANYVKEARIWIADDASRLPLKAEALNRYHPRISLKSYGGQR